MSRRTSLIPSCTAAVMAALLALGLWLPGSAPIARERPVRRTARAGTGPRALATGVWALPDRLVPTAGPGPGPDADTPVAPAAGQALQPVTFHLPAPVSRPAGLFTPSRPAPASRVATGLPPGRAPPVALS